MILLPNVTREMLDPAFWLARVADPDAPPLDPDGIRAFNARVLETLNLPDPLDLAESISAPVVCGEMTPLSENTYYDVTGAAYTPEMWAAIQANVAAGTVPDEARVRWGLVTQRTPLRYYPSLAPGLSAPGQIAFDRLQGTMLDTGWPAAVVHTSADGQWYFALTPMYWGWVQAAHVALADDREAVRRFIEAEPFVVAVASQATAAMPDGAHALAQMGTRLPLAGRDDLARRVLVPRRDGAGRLALVEGYIARDDPSWHEGYLPCTVRTAFTQAFSLLGEPYAWGGMRAGLFGRDCSRLVKDVWAVTGYACRATAASRAASASRWCALRPTTRPQPAPRCSSRARRRGRCCSSPATSCSTSARWAAPPSRSTACGTTTTRKATSPSSRLRWSLTCPLRRARTGARSLNASRTYRQLACNRAGPHALPNLWLSGSVRDSGARSMRTHPANGALGVKWAAK
ncbi:MAG: SH3 domain-containing protein [Anaerolineae bacterium]|nr:SH3 domain-containing protein [Anaerolineae bacterium]